MTENGKLIDSKQNVHTFLHLFRISCGAALVMLSWQGFYLLGKQDLPQFMAVFANNVQLTLVILGSTLILGVVLLFIGGFSFKETEKYKVVIPEFQFFFGLLALVAACFLAYQAGITYAQHSSTLQEIRNDSTGYTLSAFLLFGALFCILGLKSRNILFYQIIYALSAVALASTARSDIFSGRKSNFDRLLNPYNEHFIRINLVIAFVYLGFFVLSHKEVSDIVIKHMKRPAKSK